MERGSPSTDHEADVRPMPRRSTLQRAFRWLGGVASLTKITLAVIAFALALQFGPALIEWLRGE